MKKEDCLEIADNNDFFGVVHMTGDNKQEFIGTRNIDFMNEKYHPKRDILSSDDRMYFFNVPAISWWSVAYNEISEITPTEVSVKLKDAIKNIPEKIHPKDRK